MKDKDYVIREKDTDMKAVSELCDSHTTDELEAEWQKFKHEFEKSHRKPSE